MNKREQHKQLLVLLAVNAFIQQDGYAHFRYKDLQIGLGTETIGKILQTLIQVGELINYTVNGYYPKYKVTNPRPCPNIVFDTNVTIGQKGFILDGYYAGLKEKTSIHQMVKQLYGDIDYNDYSKQNSRLKKNTGHDVFDYINNMSYVTKEIKTTCCEKTENGYKSKTKPEKYKEKYAKRKQKNIEKGLAYFLLQKTKHSISRKNKNIINTLNEQDIQDVLEKQNYKDYYTGEPLNNTDASVDRIDSNGAYEKNNIVITTWEINKFKNNIDEKRFFELCNIIAKAHPI